MNGTPHLGLMTADSLSRCEVRHAPSVNTVRGWGTRIIAVNAGNQALIEKTGAGVVAFHQRQSPHGDPHKVAYPMNTTILVCREGQALGRRRDRFKTSRPANVFHSFHGEDYDASKQHCRIETTRA